MRNPYPIRHVIQMNNIGRHMHTSGAQNARDRHAGSSDSSHGYQMKTSRRGMQSQAKSCFQWYKSDRPYKSHKSYIFEHMRSGKRVAVLGHGGGSTKAQGGGGVDGWQQLVLL